MTSLKYFHSKAERVKHKCHVQDRVQFNVISRTEIQNILYEMQKTVVKNQILYMLHINILHITYQQLLLFLIPFGDISSGVILT